ncbi:cell wall protein [Myxococcus xanthus]|uniref:cell wall protein n=1 Tax=Myxococcus xanthus TaxID=34 RepID=UPI00112AADFB|nr:cell wall protein [Myxococcus xanthus]QDF00909.1 cell wall protein [Myxococcus xanthus]
MSIANALGEIFRRELDAQLVPLQQAVRRMEEGLEALELVREVTHRLAPLTSRLGAMAGVRTPTVLPASTRGGRKQVVAAPKGRASVGRPVAAKPVVSQARAEEGARACAVIGCERPSRSKGYCSAHYQKLRLLMRTNRRPSAWKDDALPQSVEDVTLPRGRAASKALREGGARRKAPAKAPAPVVAPPPPAEEKAPAAAKKSAGRKAAGAKKAARAKKSPAAAKKSVAKKAPAAKKAAAKGGRQVKTTKVKAGAGKRKKGRSSQGSLF